MFLAPPNAGLLFLFPLPLSNFSAMSCFGFLRLFIAYSITYSHIMRGPTLMPVELRCKLNGGNINKEVKLRIIVEKQ
jgi:hypothetical protein